MSNEVAANHESVLEGSVVSPQNTPNIQDTQTLTEEPMTFTQSSDIAWDGYFESMAVLMLLLALLWACFWAARRYGLFNMMPRAANIHREALRLEGQLSLGPRKGVMIVRCLEKRLVLGITDQNITLLTELPVEDAEKMAADTTSASGTTSAAPSPKTPPDNKLIQQFNKLLQGKKTS